MARNSWKAILLHPPTLRCTILPAAHHARPLLPSGSPGRSKRQLKQLSWKRHHAPFCHWHWIIGYGLTGQSILLQFFVDVWVMLLRARFALRAVPGSETGRCCLNMYVMFLGYLVLSCLQYWWNRYKTTAYIKCRDWQTWLQKRHLMGTHTDARWMWELKTGLQIMKPTVS